jgi:hypothetical protein
LRWLGTIRGATTLTLAGVLSLAAVVSGFTTTLTFAIVLTLAGVLVGVVGIVVSE